MDYLLVIRALLCLVVVWEHSLPPQNWLIINGYNLSFLTFPSALISVWGFYLLSGYVIGYSFVSGRYLFTIRDLFRFYWNRLIRIVPLFITAIIICDTVFYPGVISKNPAFLFKLLTFQPTDPVEFWSFNSPIMIIATEMRFYLVAPFLLIITQWLRRYIPMLMTTTVIFAIGTFIRKYLDVTYAFFDVNAYLRYIYTTVTGNLDIFLFGLLLSTMDHKLITAAGQKISAVKTLAVGFISLLTVIFYLYAGYNTLNFFNNYWGYKNIVIYILPPVASVIIGYWIILLHHRISYRQLHLPAPPHLVKMLFSPFHIFESFGILSYGIFIWHMPIVGKLLNIMPSSGTITGFFKFYLAVLTLSIVMAAGSYFAIEYPVRKLFIRKKKIS